MGRWEHLESIWTSHRGKCHLETCDKYVFPPPWRVQGDVYPALALTILRPKASKTILDPWKILPASRNSLLETCLLSTLARSTPCYFVRRKITQKETSKDPPNNSSGPVFFLHNAWYFPNMLGRKWHCRLWTLDLRCCSGFGQKNCFQHWGSRMVFMDFRWVGGKTFRLLDPPPLIRL